MNHSDTNDQTRVFDAHVHVDRGLDDYDLPKARKNIIFNEVSTYREAADSARTRGDRITLIVDTSDAFSFVQAEAQAGRIDALKIHSRISKLSERDWPLMLARLEALPAHLPVVIDAFYFGADLEHQPSIAGIVLLLSRLPERRFVIAHSGGYRLLEYFFHLREFTNVHYELSLSLQYLNDSSVAADLRKLVRHTDKRRIVFGSDYPFASPRHQLSILRSICDSLDISSTEFEDIVYGNALRLFDPAGVRS